MNIEIKILSLNNINIVTLLWLQFQGRTITAKTSYFVYNQNNIFTIYLKFVTCGSVCKRYSGQRPKMYHCVWINETWAFACTN